MLGQGVSTPYGTQNLQNLLTSQIQTPTVQQVQPMQQQMAGIQYVNDKQSAANYQMLNNQSAVLFDRNKDTFYVKQTDASGAYTIDEYEFFKVEEKPLEDNFATKDDIASIQEQLASLKQSLESQNKPIQRPSNDKKKR